MKKQNLLKVTLVAVAMFVFSGAMAQPWSNAVEGDYARSNATPITVAGDVTFGDKVTINKAMPFWVFPSVAYNPDYVTTGFGTDYTTVAQITANVISSFAWTYGTDGTGASAAANYVEISWTSTGNKTISVIETPAAGICPAVAVYFGVNVIDVPSATIDGAGTELGLTNVISSACWSATVPHEVTVSFTDGNTDEVYPYHFNVTYNVYNVDGLDAGGELLALNSIANDVRIEGSVTAGAVPSAANPIIVASGTTLVAEQDYPVQNNKITVYEIVYNNVNGQISRKSDYLAARTGSWTSTDYADFSYYPAAAAATSKYIISLPTPVTGPIYHIPNAFAF